MRQRSDFGVEREEIGVRPRLVDIANNEQHPRQLPFPELRREALHLPAISARDRFADALAHLRVEAVFWNVGERRDEAVEAVAADEDARARPVEQVQDTLGRRQQFFAADLPELFARIVFDNLAQRLGAVAAGGEAGLVHHPLGFAAQHRDVARGFGEAFAGEKPDEAHFADRLALRIVAFDGDVVRHRAPVHARADGRFCHHERIGLGHQPLQFRRQHHRLGRGAQHVKIEIAQHAEARCALDLRLIRLVAAVRQPLVTIIPRAQERKLFRRQPFQQRHRFGDFFGRRVGGRFFQLFRRMQHALTHGLKVVHRGFHVRERRPHAFMQRPRALFGKPRQVNLNEGVTAVSRSRRRDGVKHRQRGNALVRQFTHDGIDQERHVWPGDLKHVAVDRPTAGADAAANACALLLASTLRPPDPEIVRQLRQVFDGKIAEFIG